ncbi:MAG TPA: ParA family protein [Gemmatimonadaceae bacterium]
MGRVLAIVSQKGGVGKTTTAINLAVAMARRGVKTLLVDVDPQGSVRYGLGMLAPHYALGVSDYLSGSTEMQDIIRATAMPWLRVALAGTIADGGTHEDYHVRFATSPRFEELLTRAQERGYVVVIDTPPGLGPIVQRVLAQSDHVLVPLQCEPAAVQTTAQILRGIRGVVTQNQQLTFDGILLTMYEPGNAVSERVAAHVRSQLPQLVFDVAVPRTMASVDAVAAGQPVVLRAPNDAASRAYTILADELIPRLQ